MDNEEEILLFGVLVCSEERKLCLLLQHLAVAAM